VTSASTEVVRRREEARERMRADIALFMIGLFYTKT